MRPRTPGGTKYNGGVSRVWLSCARLGLLGQPRNDHQSATRRAARRRAPPDDDRAVDDASQALSELSTNVNDFCGCRPGRHHPIVARALLPARGDALCRPHAGARPMTPATRLAPRATVTEPTPPLLQRGSTSSSAPAETMSAAPAERKATNRIHPASSRYSDSTGAPGREPSTLMRDASRPAPKCALEGNLTLRVVRSRLWGCDRGGRCATPRTRSNRCIGWCMSSSIRAGDKSVNFPIREGSWSLLGWIQLKTCACSRIMHVMEEEPAADS